ncbi:ATP-binding cassette sub-family C member 9-like [Amphiura filiformis]|uniref:ATP-binding cassette sub-family C member 9-like n=1 Tax=Amphiura filiformis TaxID=82378 RepID=UPI003B216317
MDPFWDWYCGEAIENEPNGSDPAKDFLFNISLPADDECVANLLSIIPHILFIFVSSLTLTCLSCCNKCNHIDSVYLRKFPYHTFRWLLLAIFLFICMCSIAEGVLTDLTYQSIFTTQPHLYVPQCFAFLAVICSLVYFQYCEAWHSPKLAWIPLIYWLLAVVGEAVKLRTQPGFVSDEETDFVLIFRFELAIVSAVVYLIMLILELAVVCTKVSFLQYLSPEKPDMYYYEDYVNVISYSLFYWMNWLLKVGYQSPLELKHLGSLPVKHTTKYNYKKFRRNFKKEMDDATNNKRIPSMWKVYIQTYWYPFLMTFLLKLIADALVIVIPLTLDAITSNVERREQGQISQAIPHHISVSEFFEDIYVLSVIFALAPFVQFMLLQVQFYQCSVIGVHLRSAMQAIVYEKSLRLSNLSGSSLTVGEITNHMSTDAMNLLFFAQKMQLTWSVPVRLIIVMSLLYYYVGISAILGLVSVFLLLPLQAIIVKKSSKHQKEALGHADDRLKKCSEMLNGIKLLKLYGWEDIYMNLMEAVRIKELKSVLNFNTQFGFTVILCFALPVALNIVIFGTYPSLSGKDLTSSVAFTTFVLINLLVDPLYQMPAVLSNLVNAVVATKRLQKFFLVPEIDKKALDGQTSTERGSGAGGAIAGISDSKQLITKRFSWRRGWKGFSSGESQDEECNERTPLMMKSFEFDPKYVSGGGTPNISTVEEGYGDETAIKITRGHFTWDRESNTPILRNIHVAFPAGKLVMVVGAVGSGKSSLLSAIVGEMTTLKGGVQFEKKNTKVAYTTQRAWVINATLRENILFGKPFDHYKYQRIIDACALKPDLDVLPAGDLTEIGEKGINLSGGQKQRVSVARAMYSDKEIVLMDDPLSALDVHVGDHLFTDGIKGILLKAKRTVILVTHQLQHLQHANLVLVMKDGRIVEQGTFDDIVSRDANLFADWSLTQDIHSESATSASEFDDEEERRARKEQMRQKSIGVTGQNTGKGKPDYVKSTTGELMEAEELERGSVSYEVYLYLLKSMGWPTIISYLIFRILQEVANIGRQFWLAAWSDAGVVLNRTANSTEEVDSNYYVIGYTAISLGLLIATIMMALFGVIAFYLAAKHIHVAMVRNIFRSPIRFFDTTPVGRILNRLSNDTQIIDIKLMVTYFSFMYYVISLPASLLSIGIITPVFLVEIIPCFFIYIYLQRYFIRSSRELQRLDSITRSPVYAHFSETLGGLPTIRAYGEEERFFNTLLEKIDINNTAFLYLQAGYSWIGSQLNFISLTLMLMISLTTIITMEVSGLSSSYVGLSLSYAITVTYLLYMILRFAADTEIQMNAVERVRHYTQLSNEDPSGTEPPPTWPSLGGIQIEDIYVRYADNLPPVLTGVNLYVRPGEKVGICGRTGSGKSSLTLTLFRLINMFEGRILIDGEDIARLPLATLRRRLSIIPQDPMLFSGSIRNNLDPEGKKTDSDLWKALETAQLKAVVSELETGLDYVVTEGGENFSVGQRQLFCVARAFLRNSKILIMDEATASIDYDTEKVLQTVTSSAFLDKTVITIAHRISTIMNSDTIVVLNEGKIVEHDTPEILLSKKSSLFASLVQANKVY